MRFLARIIFSYVLNALALLAAATYIPGFIVAGGIQGLLTVALIFTALTVFVRPFFKFVLTPVIILTLGLGIFVLNAAMLWLLDFFSEQVTMETLETLLYATLLISALHFFLNVSARFLFRPRSL